MSIVAHLLLAVLVPLVTFAPGFALVSRIRRWGPLETLTASIAGSIVVIYLVAFGIYISGLPMAAGWALTALSAVILIRDRRAAWRVLAAPQVRRVLRLLAALYAWNLLMLMVVRHYGGGLWGPDWHEHYERAMFFVERWPVDYEFLDRYLLPARPPLMNVYAAFFVAQTGTAFSQFQFVFAFMNLLPFVPLVLLSSVLARRHRGGATLLAMVLACSPMFLHNAQFTWTKSGTGFFVVLALWFYIVGWRRQDPLRMSLAFVSLAAAMLVHYSAAPYLLAVALHYLVFVVWRRQHPVKEMLTAGVASAALLATWVAFSVVTYGLQDTLASNTAVTDAARMTPRENLVKIATNVGDTLVPHVLRGHWLVRDDPAFRQVADNAFQLYQTNLPLMFGVGGALAVCGLIARTASRRPRGGHAGERLFWLLFATTVVLLGIAAHGDPDIYGLGHIGLQPLVQIGLAWLAASLPDMPRLLRYVFVVALPVDVIFGIAVRLRLESLLAGWAVDHNFEVKQAAGLTYIGDWLPGLSVPLQVAVWVGCAVVIGAIHRRLHGSPGTRKLARRAV